MLHKKPKSMKQKILNRVQLCALLLSSCLATNANAASPPGDVVGKVVAGYQGWFYCGGDGGPHGADAVWMHWSSPNRAVPPSLTNSQGIHSWPDMREYSTSYLTNYPNLGSGQPAKLYSSNDPQTVDTQCRWMQENGISTVALGRFNPNADGGPNASLALLQPSAEKYGRKFYAAYDLSGWINMQTEIKTDWLNRIGPIAASSAAYAKQNGKPVVQMWGLGMNDSDRPWSPTVCLEVINWFKSQGCYVIGGVTRDWRTKDASYLPVYNAMNMIQPWMIGVIGNAADSDSYYTSTNVPDQAYCNANGLDYMPCILTGDLQARQRHHGDFMWRQFYNTVRVGAQSIFLSMFDEYNEGNQIAKTAENSSQVPAGSGILTLDEDGTACSADYYLRLTNDGGKMLAGTIPLTATRPTVPMPATAPKKLVPGTTVTLQALANNKYVCADNAGVDPLIANRTSAGAWEHYLVVDAGSGRIALRATANNQYVCADNYGNNPLVASRTSYGFWETFTEVDAGSGRSAMRALVNSRYVCADNTGASPLIANRTTFGTWESFTAAP
jgi:hypothetical protein